MKKSLSIVLSLLIVCGGLFSASAQASMVSTGAAISQQGVAYDRASLRAALNEKGVKEQLLALGVDPQEVDQRIDSLTQQELVQLNSEIQQLPAGQGAVGILLTIFVVFVITDMLCATNIFSFVRCIN